MATITNRTAESSPRFLAAAGVVRQPGRFASPGVSRWRWESRQVADEVDAAYAEAKALAAESKAIADERAALVEEFVAARQTRVWMEELRVLAKAKRFDDAHPSRDSLFEELHALEMYGEQYPEAA